LFIVNTIFFLPEADTAKTVLAAYAILAKITVAQMTAIETPKRMIGIVDFGALVT
jgi:hypothetical protein